MGAQDDALLAELPQRLNAIPRRWAAETPDAPALSEGGVAWSWRRLAEAVDEAVALLRASGVRAGDRVTVAVLGLIFCLFFTTNLLSIHAPWAASSLARAISA